MKIPHNGYIDYLNSLHNVSANGANALAESQALNEYFPELYQPFPIVEHIVALLNGDRECVVILTGHAGDGKSTIALDVLKKLRGIPSKQKLDKPLDERELVGQVNIIKDMSELSAEQRVRWLKESFEVAGSWLVVSNTGPLLSSLLGYVEESGQGGREQSAIESNILAALNQPLGAVSTKAHRIDGFKKDLVILNLTRLDNINLGATLLKKLVEHPAWENCSSCLIQGTCPIKVNRDVVCSAISTVVDRVRWLYSRLGAYEHRLTLRQIIAHHSYAITGGVSCELVQQKLTGKYNVIESLEKIIFSESFFGMEGGKYNQRADSLHAISLLRRMNCGAPAGVEYDRSLSEASGMSWSESPQGLGPLQEYWRNRINDLDTGTSAGIRWRYALRRMAYVFESVKPELQVKANIFLDTFLESASLRQFEEWKIEGRITLRKSDTNRLCKACLQVLLEFFTGFSANQYQDEEKLYLTLRRKDKNVVQPTQLVIETVMFREFELLYDTETSQPKLSFRNGEAELQLSLPLFDFIQERSRGEIGSSLSPIYHSQIDWFHAELIKATEDDRDDDDEEISLIRAGINGVVTQHTFVLNNKKIRLEVC